MCVRRLSGDQWVAKFNPIWRTLIFYLVCQPWYIIEITCAAERLKQAVSCTVVGGPSLKGH